VDATLGRKSIRKETTSFVRQVFQWQAGEARAAEVLRSAGWRGGDGPSHRSRLAGRYMQNPPSSSRISWPPDGVSDDGSTSDPMSSATTDHQTAHWAMDVPIVWTLKGMPGADD